MAQAKNQVYQLVAVDAFAGKYAEGARSRHTIFESGRFVPHEIRELDQEDERPIQVVESVQ